MKYFYLNTRINLSVYIYILISRVINLLLISETSYSAVYYVDANKTNNFSDGLSWKDAKKTIKAALDTAAAGDKIWVKKGAYSEMIVMKSGIELYGGFAGFETSASERGKENERSVVDASNVKNNLHVVSYYFNTNTRLDGFKIMGGHAKGEFSYNIGGGIMCLYTDKTNTIANCEITSNTAEYLGGGIACAHNSTPVITDCIIYGNSANTGGGVCFTNASPIISNCIIAGNKSDWLCGGLASMDRSTAEINNCIISGNTGYIGGGFIFYNASPSMNNCIISGNYSKWTVGAGALFTTTGTINNCIISGNSALKYCGGIGCNLSSSPKITNCIFENNPNYAIYEFEVNSDPVLINNIFQNNPGRVYNDFEDGDKMGAEAINTLPGNRDNISADPKFFMNSKFSFTGKWTSPPIYDSEKKQTTLTDANANLPAVANVRANLFVCPLSPGDSALNAKSLSGRFINTDSSQYLQSLILCNTETQIIVYGDVTSFVNTNDTYKIIDYRSGYKSGAVDAVTSPTLAGLKK